MKHMRTLSAMMTLFFSLFFLPAALPAAPVLVDFQKGSLVSLQRQAAQDGKLYFVNFTASWCMPCRVMDESTYTDPGLAAYISRYYLAAKVDVDDFDGVAYKNQYHVDALPTILVFSSQGKLLARYEESLSASRMLEVLKKYNTGSNRTESAAKPSPAAPASISRPPLAPTRPTIPAEVAKSPAAPAASGSGLFQFDVQKQASEGFAVQVGVYADYENVLRESARFKTLFSEKVLVHIDKLGDKSVYRVLIGQFNARSSAEAFAKKVKEKGLEGFVKDLSLLL